MKTPRMAVLISGTGTNMEALLKACIAGELAAETAFVGSDKLEAKGLATARALGAETRFFSYKEGKEAAEAAIAEAVEYTQADWIVLAGFMRILSPDFVRRYAGRIVNIHPSLLPAFPGAHGIQDAWDYGVKITGVTVHLVDEGVDSGTILAQRAVEIMPDDTLESVEEKIHKIEHSLYKETLQKLFAENPAESE